MLDSYQNSIFNKKRPSTLLLFFPVYASNKSIKKVMKTKK
ncbi:hypothetical protein HMPREF0201_04442 [Cedecea davisae DSM 4568]|uniref:Uncharacterized protein n=1 Tax=Cedecea davisae DSM 4568 TaxID=566551 RepID=S3JI23_9ENTR|nr:hypothetical protein HMPREF0201_04442 [Cedecea davisae DSM 4568]